MVFREIMATNLFAINLNLLFCYGWDRTDLNEANLTIFVTVIKKEMGTACPSEFYIAKTSFNMKHSVW
jgi:hypothetical protein